LTSSSRLAEQVNGAAENGVNQGPVPLADPVAEGRRLVDAAAAEGLTVRTLGGVAIHMQAPGQQPLLPRALKDIDLVTTRDDASALARLLADVGYVGDEMFNALRGSRRQLHRDPHNERDLDVFVEEFSLCHTLPIAARLDRDRYTIPLAELLLTKLQIVELNERDERDIYTLCYHHQVSGSGDGIEADLIAELCAGDWGLWRTCVGTIERCRDDIDRYNLGSEKEGLITDRLAEIQQRIDEAPKTGKWRWRSRIGERKRWYSEPEEE
jgi:hypothetical protein